MDFQAIFGLSSGLAIATLGMVVWVALRKLPHRNGLLPAFLTIWGLNITLANLTRIVQPENRLLLTHAANLTYLTLGVYAIHVASTFRAVRPKDWPSWVALHGAAILSAAIVTRPQWFATPQSPFPQVNWGTGVALLFLMCGFAVIVFALSVRLAQTPHESARSDIVVLLAALLLYLHSYYWI